MKITALLVALLLLAPGASALDLAGRDLFIPIAGRTPGAGGTFWQTDLVITNLSSEYGQLPVRVEFHSEGRTEFFELAVPYESSVVVEDFLRTKLGREQGLGTLRITSTTPDAQLATHAVVSNQGEYGQSVPGMPLAALKARSVVSGLRVLNGYRSNVGIANPHDEPVKIDLMLSDGNFTEYLELVLAPREVRQLDALLSLSFPPVRETLTAFVYADEPVYAYGSVVRGSTGDPLFVLPVERRPSSDFVVQPACANPAPLQVGEPAAPGWIVVFKDGIDTTAVAAEMAARLGFTPTDVLKAVNMMFVEVPPQTLAAIRCEPTVKVISQNSSFRSR